MLIHGYLLVSLLFGRILADFQCKPSPHCRCYLDNDSFKYSCPKNVEDFHIGLIDGEGVEVNCLDGHLKTWENSVIPNIGVSNVETVQLIYCPIPNFVKFIDQLGVNSTKNIEASSRMDNILTEEHFKGLENLQKLSMSNCRIQSIHEASFNNLNTLLELELISNYLTHLKPKTFQNLNNLKELNLATNKLSNLSESLFEDLTKLEVLNLWQNSLSELSTETFRNLRNLTTLELSYNKIEAFPEDIFDSLSSLKRLILIRNKLETLPATLFKSLTNLEVIKLSDNYLKNLPDSLFEHSTSLKVVEMEYCNLTTLPDTLFQSLLNLENVTLSHNKFELIPNAWFSNSKKIQNLDLSFNNLEKLSSGIFLSLAELKVLKLGNNRLSDLGHKSFDKLRNLEKLYLNNNQLTELPIRIFANLDSLKEIYLANNYLEFPKDSSDIYDFNFLQNSLPFNTNFGLEVIDLKNNSVSSVGEDLITNKIKLRKLDLSYNRINSLSLATLITASVIPKVINLKHNNITTVYFQIENLRYESNDSTSTTANGQTTVILDYNPINCDCNVYDLTKYFERTFDNSIRNLLKMEPEVLNCASPQNLIGVPLKKLESKSVLCSLDKTQEDICPARCRCKKRIWDEALLVDCSRANLTAVPKLVNPKILFFEKTEVDLQHNLLTAAPTPEMGYENVSSLIMSYNIINNLTWIPPRVKVFKLDANNMSYLSVDILAKLNSSHITDLSLGSNPWICDCSAVDFYTYIVSHPKTLIDAHRIYCRNEDSLLRSLSTYYMCPTSQLSIYVLCSVIILTILIICLSIVFYYHNERKIKVWLFARNWCLWFVTEEEIDKDKLYDAFISYSHKDEDFVLNELQSVLEQGPNPYKLCLHIRDWIPGESISRQIVKSVEDSRRTLVILSPHFLDSVWGTMEFRTAHTQAMSEGRARVIIVLYGDFDVDANLDDELKAYIKTNTYVKWDDPWFWDKLRYALPHSNRLRVRDKKKKSQKSQNLKINLNDKSVLMNSFPTTPSPGPGTTPPAISLNPLFLEKHSINLSDGVQSPVESGYNPMLIASQ